MSRRCDLLSIGSMVGNNVSHSNRKTRRKFQVNLKNVRFVSESLGLKLSFKVAASTLRTINKYQGIDNFLTSYPYRKLSSLAIKFRSKIKKKSSPDKIKSLK